MKAIRKMLAAAAVVVAGLSGCLATSGGTASASMTSWAAYSRVDGNPRVSFELMLATMNSYDPVPGTPAFCLLGEMQHVWNQGEWTSSKLQSEWNWIAMELLTVHPLLSNFVSAVVDEVVPSGETLEGKLVSQLAQRLIGTLFDWQVGRSAVRFALTDGGNLTAVADTLMADGMSACGLGA